METSIVLRTFIGVFEDHGLAFCVEKGMNGLTD